MRMPRPCQFQLPRRHTHAPVSLDAHLHLPLGTILLAVIVRGPVYLLDQLAQRSDDETIEVVFWLQCEDAPDWRAILNAGVAGGAGVEQARRDARDAAEAWFAARTADFASGRVVSLTK